MRGLSGPITDFDLLVNQPQPRPSPLKTEGFSANHSEGRSRQLFSDTTLSLTMIGDFAMILFGLVLGFWLRFRSGWIPLAPTWWTSGDSVGVTLTDYLNLIAIGAIILFVTLLNLGLYRRQNLLRYRQVVRTFVGGTYMWLVVYFVVSQAVVFNPSISRLYMICSFVSVNLSVLTWRGIFHSLLQNEVAARGLRQNILFVGWSKNVHHLFDNIYTDHSHPYSLVGYVEAPNKPVNLSGIPTVRSLGNFNELRDIVVRESIHIIVLAEPDMALNEIVSLSNFCERELIQFKVIPSYFQILVSGLHLETISGVPIMGVSALPLDHAANQLIKRTVDIVGGLVGLVLSIPIIAVCGVLIYLESPGPIFYSQVRTGRNGRSFRIYKLRSMKLDAEKAGTGWSTKNDDRRLKIGSVLRNLNLDEVPQFWNVLKGDMSLVGPRPERPELIAQFRYDIPHYNARLATKPGITGWAQVNGLRGDTDLTERVRYDLYYLENWTPLLDFYIMFLTFVRRENAY